MQSLTHAAEIAAQAAASAKQTAAQATQSASQTLTHAAEAAAVQAKSAYQSLAHAAESASAAAASMKVTATDAAHATSVALCHAVEAAAALARQAAQSASQALASAVEAAGQAADSVRHKAAESASQAWSYKAAEMLSQALCSAGGEDGCSDGVIELGLLMIQKPLGLFWRFCCVFGIRRRTELESTEFIEYHWSMKTLDAPLLDRLLDPVSRILGDPKGTSWLRFDSMPRRSHTSISSPGNVTKAN